MALSTFRWAIIDDDETTIVCAQDIEEAIEEAGYPSQPNAVVRLGYAEWDSELQTYK